METFFHENWTFKNIKVSFFENITPVAVKIDFLYKINEIVYVIYTIYEQGLTKLDVENETIHKHLQPAHNTEHL